MTTPKDRHALLEEYVHEDRPSLFAIFGPYNNVAAGELCGWGMEWADGYGTIFYEPATRNMWRSESARQVLDTCRIFADATLVWLEPDATP